MKVVMWGARCGWGLLAAMTISSAAATAQDRNPQASARANLPPGAVVQPLDSPAAEALRRNLTELADNPQNVSALVDAGRAALDMGDPDAALTFFSRADALEPRNPRAKAGMASALAELEQPQAAIGLFDEAVSLGAPEAEIAGDRGLAYDSLGDPARAQRDYNLALRNRDDPEIRRRLALSLAISGQRDAALRAIDAQLRNNDRAAWRTQAFVLALTGDAAGADRTAARVMPPAAARAIAPFMARMASLSPSQKALAVHFGHFPGNGRPSSPTTSFADAGPPPPAPAPTTRARPDASAAPVHDRRQWPVSPLERGAVSGAGGQRATLADALRRPSAPAPNRPVARFQPNAPDSRTATPASTGDAAPGFSLAPSGPQPGAERPPVVPVEARPFSEVAAVVNALPQEPRREARVTPPPSAAPAMTDRQIRDALARENERRGRPATPPARTRTAAAEPPRPAPQRRSSRPAPPANPSRVWVQIAGGANRATLPREFARLRALAPQLLGNRQAWTTPLNATNRLLVGPFANAREAQAFVNQLAGHEISAFAWTSPAGQEIERLQTR